MARPPLQSRQVAVRILTVIALFILGRSVTVWSELPPMMASHFDGSGVPNGYQSKSVFVGIILGMVLLLSAVFGVMPLFMARVPPQLLNLPHREYWMVPERSEKALEIYATWSSWFGVVTLGLIFAIFELVIQANLLHQPMNPHVTWLLIVAYLLYTPVAIWRLYALMKPPK